METLPPPVAPPSDMDRILAVYHMSDLTPRVRVEGIITYYQPGSSIVLQDGSKSLWIQTHTREPLQIGDQADATGGTSLGLSVSADLGSRSTTRVTGRRWSA